MSVEIMELFSIFSKTYTKEEAQTIVNDIEKISSDHKRDVATKADLRETELKLTKEIESVRLRVEQVRGEIKEVELKLTKEIEQAKSSTIKWVVGWTTGLLIAQTGAVLTMLTLLK